MVHVAEPTILRLINQLEFKGFSYPLVMPDSRDQINTIAANGTLTITLPDDLSIDALNAELSKFGVKLDKKSIVMFLVAFDVSASDNVTLKITHSFDTSILPTNLKLPDQVFEYNIAQLPIKPFTFIMPYKQLKLEYTNSNAYSVTVQNHVVASLTSTTVLKSIIDDYIRTLRIGDQHAI